MKVNLLRHYIKRTALDDLDVVIAVKLPYATVGPMPTVDVRSISTGFDWDSGKLIIQPERVLTLADAEFDKRYHDLQERCGMLQLEINRLHGLLRKAGSV